MATQGELTRNESYESEQPLLSGKCKAVIEFVRARGTFGATREEIAEGTGLRLSCVCGRVRELLDSEQLVESDQRRIGSSGKSQSVVTAKEVSGNAWQFQGTWACERQGREQSDSQIDGKAGAGNSRQQGEGHGCGVGGKVQSEPKHDLGHSSPQGMAALEAERIDAAVQFVTDERKPIETWRVGIEIMNLRSRGILAWPSGDSDQWVAAVEAAVKQGRLVLMDGKVRLPAPVDNEEAKVVQKELF